MRFVLWVLTGVFGLSLWNFHHERIARLADCSRALRPGETVSHTEGVVEKRSALEWRLREGKRSFRLRSALPLDLFEGSLVRIEGKLFCQSPPENPSRSAGLLQWIRKPETVLRISHIHIERVVEKRSLRSRFETWVREAFAAYPQLAALERALWFGDLTGFSQQIREFYLVSGSLAVLALSGQHVAGLFLLSETVSNLFFLFLWKVLPLCYRRAMSFLFCRWKILQPLFCSGVLLYTSGYSPSMVRTTAMVFSVCLVRFLGISSSLLQILSTSAGLLLLLDPFWMLSPGFVLSVAATGSVFALTARTRWFLLYLAFSFALPLLLLPWTSYYFSKLALASFFLQFPLSLLWDFCIVPIGFLLPFFAFLRKGGSIFFPFLEESWGTFLRFQEKGVDFLQSTYSTSFRIHDMELFLLEICLLGAMGYKMRRNFHLPKRVEGGD